MRSFNYNAYRQEQLEKEIADVKLAREIDDIAADPVLDDVTALVLIGRKLQVLKPTDTIKPKVKLDVAAFDENLRQLVAFSKVRHLYGHGNGQPSAGSKHTPNTRLGIRLITRHTIPL